MARNELRVVGLNESDIFIQIKCGDDWAQSRLPLAGFVNYMKAEYPSYYAECENELGTDSTDYEKCNWFYNYGEDGTETYIFK